MLSSMEVKSNGRNSTATEADLKEASRLRRKLIDLFGGFDTLSKRLAGIGVEGAEGTVQLYMIRWANTYLQTNMLPLQTLPRVLNSSTESSSNAGTSAEGLSEKEEVEIRDTLIVLEEQRFLVQNMLHEAKNRRKFDEMDALQASLADLDIEINHVTDKLA